MTAIRKALAAGLVWAAGTFAPTMLADGKISVGELLTVLLGTPVAGWIVYRVPNEQSPK